MNVRTILSLALVAIAFALGGCATASKDSSFDSKPDGTVKEVKKETCTGWGCSNTSNSHRRAPSFVPGQYNPGYLGGYDVGAGRGYAYGQQVGDTPRDLAAQGFTYTPSNGYVQGLRKQWSYAVRVQTSNGSFALICWPKQRPLGTNDNLADGTPICKDGL